jgi:hypothetical protein
MIRQLSDQDMDSVLNVWLESRLVNGGTDLFIGMTVLSWPRVCKNCFGSVASEQRRC